ncbi:MAG: hypothetical protein EDM03_14500 [Porphyrobacter sp. IPPAS B-1204]|nr:MAG: hypothetical protein EDM03_14500 [Porphyrobacter sp. IPPAS B-1204]
MMKAPFIVSLLMAAITVPVAPASAQESGAAMTLESGGTQPGCVVWERFVVPAPDRWSPQFVRIFFRFRNACNRTIYIGMHHQTGCCAERVSMIVSHRLAPGEVYGGAGHGLYINFDPPTDRYLNFWLFQSDRPFIKTNRVDMTRCYPGFDPKKAAPPCPPAFRL